MIYDHFLIIAYNQKIMVFKSIIIKVINEVLWKKSPFTILLVEILICKGLFLSKNSKPGSNLY